jgi:chromatin remodeling complex protein RSC6
MPKSQNASTTNEPTTEAQAVATPDEGEVQSAPAVVDESTGEVDDDTLDKRVVAKVGDAVAAVKALSVAMKELSVACNAISKDYAKLHKKNRKPKNPVTRKSGFAKPTNLSVEICDFLKVPHDTQMARTDVTRALTAYIHENNLQDANDGRIILLDETLKSLMKNAEGNVPEKVTYFNMQSMIKHHFIKVA